MNQRLVRALATAWLLTFLCRNGVADENRSQESRYEDYRRMCNNLKPGEWIPVCEDYGFKPPNTSSSSVTSQDEKAFQQQQQQQELTIRSFCFVPGSR